MGWFSVISAVLSIIATGLLVANNFCEVPEWTGALMATGGYATVILAREIIFQWKFFSEFPAFGKWIIFFLIFLYGLNLLLDGCLKAGGRA